MTDLNPIVNELFRKIDATCNLTVGQVIPVSEAIEKAVYDAYQMGVNDMVSTVAESSHKLTQRNKDV